jgi:hypothetical protein
MTRKSLYGTCFEAFAAYSWQHFNHSLGYSVKEAPEGALAPSDLLRRTCSAIQPKPSAPVNLGGGVPGAEM